MIEEVFQIVKAVGTNFVKDLWSVDDIAKIRFTSERLVELEERAKVAINEEDKQYCRDAANRHINNLKIIALSRVNVAMQDIYKTIEKSFFSVLVTSINPVLGTLAGILMSKVS